MSSQLFREHQYIIFDLGTERQQVPGDSVDLAGFQVTHFSGQALGEQLIFDSNFSTIDRNYPSVSKVADSMGEWMAVGERITRTGREFIIFADAFGYCPVFYARLNKHKVAISDSFHGVAAAMEKLAVKRTVNLPNYLSALSGSQQQSQTIYSDQTMIEEIRVLRPDKFMHMSSANGVSFLPRAQLGTAFRKSDYNQALSSGLDLSNEIFTSMARFEDLDKRITLSGGVDSRMVLAMLVASGQHGQYKVSSVDPRTWHFKKSRHIVERDIELADLIRKNLELSWWHPGERTKVPTGFRESLWAYQGHRSNYHYMFRPMRLFTLQNHPSITLRGGGGEIISSTSAGQIASEKFARSNADDPFHWLGQYFMNTRNTIPELHEFVQDYIERTHKKYAADTIRQSIDNHYFHARNRAHFGHMGYSRTINEVAIHMLSNPFLLNASALIPFEDRANNVLVRDIFLQSAPELLNFAFANDESFLNSKDTSQTPKSAVRGEWVKGYDRAKIGTGNVEFAVGREPRKTSTQSPVDIKQAAKNYLKWAFALIEELLPTEYKSLVNNQHRLILSRVDTGQPDIYQTVAKAASVLDGFFPQPALGAKLVRFCSPKVGKSAASIKPVVINYPSVTLLPEAAPPIFEQRPELEYVNSGFQIVTHFHSESDHEFRFAYYLLRDGERVANRWYQREPYVFFEGPFEPGRYQAISHVRIQDESKPTYFSKSSIVEI
jgi:hypothetical protein